MKKIIPILLFGLILYFPSCNQDKSKKSDNKIVIGTIDSLYSKILNEERKIWVYTPGGNPLFAAQKYPVVFLLDGEGHFYSVMGMIQQLSEVNGNTVLPQMILVGIANTDRTRDLTPTHVSTSPEIPDTNFLKTSGGGEKFTSFIEKELIPYVDSLYPAAPYRILIGHSFGGLMVMNTLVNHTKLFNAYISLDPSMWWDNKKLLDQTKSVLTEKDLSGTTLYLAVANTMESYLDTTTVKKDTSTSTRHIRSVLELSRYLDKNPQNNLKYSWKYYKDDDHASVPLLAEYDAFRFIYNFYKPDIQIDQMRKSSFNVDSMIRKYSQVLTDNFGYKSFAPEPFINRLGYMFMANKQYDKAFSSFKLVNEFYPESANGYDSMGELLMNKGDTLLAIENYEKSLKLNPGNDNAKKMIAKMKEKYKEKN